LPCIFALFRPYNKTKARCGRMPSHWQVGQQSKRLI
jgi:hypothetical protein